MPSTRSQAGVDTPAGEAAEVAEALEEAAAEWSAEEKEGDSEAEKEAQNREFVVSLSLRYGR